MRSNLPSERLTTFLLICSEPNVFICSNPIVILMLYKRCITSPEVDDVEGLAAAASKHLELLKQKDEAESSFIIEKIVGKLLNRT
jgi:hypothetical protein